MPLDSSIDTGGVGAELYARNPANPDEYTVVTGSGVIFRGSAEGVAQVANREPFTEFHYQIQSRDQNNAAVVDITYGDQGWLAFIVRSNDNIAVNNDGAWFIKNGAAFQLLRDCPREGHAGCQTVLGEGRDVWRWTTHAIKWRPNSTENVLIVLNLPEEGRRGFVIQATNWYRLDVLPPLYRYDSANWSADGSRVLISGRDPGGQHVIGWLDPETGEINIFFNGSAAGVYVQDAIERPNGAILAFAASTPGGAVRLVDGGGRTISGQVGTSPPEMIEWNYARDAALVQTTDGRSYYVSANGSIRDASGGVSSVPVVGGIETTGTGVGVVPAASIPSGVIEGSVYSPGQQLRVLADGGLNVRAEPSTGTSIVGSLARGDYIVVLAGPVQDEQYTWWRVQDAFGTQGWVAGVIGGVATISPP